MADREDIIETINLYGLAIDTQRWHLFDRIFTPDTEADYGPSMHWTDLARFKDDFATFHALFDATQHVMTNHLVRVDGDTAVSNTYGQWRLVRAASGDPPIWDGTGYYDDVWTRTGAGWRIVKRMCRVVFWTGNPKVQTPLEDMKFELDLVSLKGEGDGGRLSILKALG